MTVHNIESTVQQTNQWLHALTDAPTIADDHRAYAVLRAVLHRLRDRMIPDEAVQFGAQLPTLVRGVYYENWKPGATPTRDRDRESFLEALREGLDAHPEVDPQQAFVQVWSLLWDNVDRGALEHVLGMLPREVQDLLRKESVRQ